MEKHAKLIVVLAVVAGATSGVLGRWITAPPEAIGFYRLLFSLPFFVVPVLLFHRKTLGEISAKDWVLAVLSGVFLFGHFFAWFTAVKSISIAGASTLAALHPIFVLIGTVVILKVRVKGREVVGILMALVGGAVMAGFEYSLSSGNLLGNIAALMTAVFMAIYFLIGRVVRARVAAQPYVMIVFATCAICFFFAMLGKGTSFTVYPISDFFWIIVMMLVCQIGSHAMLNWCLAHVKSLYVSTWGTFDLVIGSGLAIVVFAEVPGITQIVGMAMTVGGLLYYNRHSS